MTASRRRAAAVGARPAAAIALAAGAFAAGAFAAGALAAGALAGSARLSAAQAPAARQPASRGAQLGLTVTPDTVAVGDPFVVRVRIRAPRGARVEFPLAPDSASQVELLDPRLVRAAPDSTATDVTAVYRAAAWDVGRRNLGLADVVVRTGAGDRRVSLSGARVYVRSVLPTDSSAARDPKPPRAIFEPAAPWWRRWLPYLIAAAIAALLAAWLWRRMRRPRPGVAADPYADAEGAFARVEKLGLVEAGEYARYVTLVVEVLRAYLARRVPNASAALTSSEVVRATAAGGLAPVGLLEPLLTESDLVKFARLTTTADRARALGRAARDVVKTTEDAVRRVEEERLAAERAAKQPVQVTTKRRDDTRERAA